jgi:hypothetical protein
MKTYFANDITNLFDKKRQHDCIINIKQTHTRKNNIRFKLKYKDETTKKNANDNN